MAKRIGNRGGHNRVSDDFDQMSWEERREHEENVRAFEYALANDDRKEEQALREIAKQPKRCSKRSASGRL